jgi:hypothetical protein
MILENFQQKKIQDIMRLQWLGKCIVFHYQFNQPNHAQVNVTEELQ